jgi:hypothetical protein
VLPGGPVPTPAEVEIYRKAQAALVKSEFVTNAALRDPKLRDVEALRKHDPAVWLAEHPTAGYGESSSMCRTGHGRYRWPKIRHLLPAILTCGTPLALNPDTGVAARKSSPTPRVAT